VYLNYKKQNSKDLNRKFMVFGLSLFYIQNDRKTTSKFRSIKGINWRCRRLVFNIDKILKS